MAHPYATKISSTSELDYLREHFGKMEEAVKQMREALDEDNAGKFIDCLGAVQWQERSILFGCKSMMHTLGFTEKDLMMKKLDKYAEPFWAVLHHNKHCTNVYPTWQVTKPTDEQARALVAEDTEIEEDDTFEVVGPLEMKGG